MHTQVFQQDYFRLPVFLLLASMLFAGGCSRMHYRLQADNDVTALVDEKSNDPRWALPCFSIEMDPRSRFYDQYDPDHPPMPEDDPASHEFMHRVYCKDGHPCWHADGERESLENPHWRDYLGDYVELTKDGEVILTLDSSMQLARIHSTDYQSEIETLYLSALDVSTERFRLDTQFFGGNSTEFTHLGRVRSGGEANTLNTDTDLFLQRKFATAGELLVGFANSFVWQFAGPDTNNTISLLNFNLVQPLLRAGGRDIALEQLTIVERGLLANLRAFQRFHHGFYTEIAIGESGVSGPQRRGGFFGGTGLTGFTGTGAGGLGGVGGVTGFGRGGAGGGGGGAGGGAGAGFAGGGVGQVGGFIGLLQILQQNRNTRVSLNLQMRTLEMLEDLRQGGMIDLVQVDQFRQSIATQSANLLQAEDSLKNSLEDYKTGTLNLPANLPIVLDDSLIRQFQFIDPQISEFQNQIAAFVDSFGALPDEPDLQVLQHSFDQVATFRQIAESQFAPVLQDLQILDQHYEKRLRETPPEQRQQFIDDIKDLHESVANLQTQFEKIGPSLQELRNQARPDNRGESANQLIVIVTDISKVVEELTLKQARARLEVITVEPLDLTPEQALNIARVNRLDWMNNRANLVDSWRLITFNADALQSTLDITFSGDLSTDGNNPVNFRGSTGRLHAGLRFDAPLTRLIERNNYRQSLIDYQRDRRQLIQFEDGVDRGMRQSLRFVEFLRKNLEIQRQAVIIAIRRVDQTRQDLSAPPPPVQPGEVPAVLGPTIAQNLLSALADLSATQDAFMSVWLQYYAMKMRLMREMGIMVIDDRGMWVNQTYRELDLSFQQFKDNMTTEAPLPPPIPEIWVRQLDQLDQRLGSQPQKPLNQVSPPRDGDN